MKKLQKINKNFWTALLINFLVAALLLLFFYPQFESKLDIMMQSILYGSNGVYSAHLVFSNIIVGKLMDFGMFCLPDMPWYIIYHDMMVFISLVTITYITLIRNPNVMGKTVSVLFTVFIGYECYISPNYMKTASLLCAAAVYLLYYNLRQERHKKLYHIMTAFLAIMSSLVCFSIFVLVGILSLLSVIIFYLFSDHNIQWLKKCWILLLTIVVLAITFDVIDTQFYKLNDEWSQSAKYRNSVEKMLGYGSADYSKEVGIELGMSEAEYQLLINGIFVDLEEPALKLLENISGQYKEFSFNTISRFFKTVPIRAFKTGMFYCWLVLLFILFLFGTNKRKLTFLISLGLLCVVYLILYFLNAWEYHWMSVAVFLPICIIVLMAMEDLKVFGKEYIWIYLGILGIILYDNFSSVLNTSVRDKMEMVQYFEEISANEEAAYMIDAEHFLKQFSAFCVYPKGFAKLENLYSLNGVYQTIGGFGQTGFVQYLDKEKYERFYLQVMSGTDVGQVVEKIKENWDVSYVEYYYLEKQNGLDVYELIIVE